MAATIGVAAALAAPLLAVAALAVQVLAVAVLAAARGRASQLLLLSALLLFGLNVQAPLPSPVTAAVGLQG